MWDSFSLGGGARYDLGDHKFSFNLGGEWRPVQPLALRTGYTLSPYGNVWSTGAGFSFSGFGLDLAYNLHEYKEFSMLRIGLNPELSLENSHTIDMSFISLSLELK